MLIFVKEEKSNVRTSCFKTVYGKKNAMGVKNDATAEASSRLSVITPKINLTFIYFSNTPSEKEIFS